MAFRVEPRESTTSRSAFLIETSENAGSGGELALFPAEEGASRAYLFARNHRNRMGHNGSFQQQKVSAFG